MIITRAEAAEWLYPLLEGKSAMKLMILFGGDRILSCDEAVAIESDGSIVGIATISPRGEDGSGQPTIVGAFILPAFRGRGLGRQLIMNAVQRCLDRGFLTIRLDIMSSAMEHIVESLPKEIRSKLVVINHSGILDIFPG